MKKIALALLTLSTVIGVSCASNFTNEVSKKEATSKSVAYIPGGGGGGGDIAIKIS